MLDANGIFRLVTEISMTKEWLSTGNHHMVPARVGSLRSVAARDGAWRLVNLVLSIFNPRFEQIKEF